MIAYYGLPFHPDWMYLQDCKTLRMYHFQRRMNKKEGDGLVYENIENKQKIVMKSDQIVKGLYWETFKSLSKEDFLLAVKQKQNK